MKSKIFPHKLSLIIPAHRQAGTIVRDVRRIESVLKQIRYDYEIIVVVDGYGDGTYRSIKKYVSPKVKSTVYMKNQGKGHAVRLGMSQATGSYIAFIDSGMEIDPNGISMLLEHLEWYEADVIVGSKRHPASQVNYPLTRRVMSRIYQYVIRLLFNLNITDTQTGLKIYKRRVVENILPRLVVKRYAFDLEMLAVARLFGFKRIYEAPIKLKYNFQDMTHASAVKSIINILIDTAAIFYRINILHYYQNWKPGKNSL